MFNYYNAWKAKMNLLYSSSIEAKKKLPTPKYKKEFMLRLNKRNASLLQCALAFVIRSMYYYRVEDIDIWEYINKKDFINIYNDLRYMMLFIDGKSKETFKKYKSYKVYIKKK